LASANDRKPDFAGNWFSLAAAIIAATTLLRVVSLWFNSTELFFDEAQYWLWGKEPAFGYFSKPPLLAWIIGAATAVCGDSEFCVRLPSPLLHAATALMVYATAAMLFDRRTSFWAAITYLLLPAVSLSSELISTDVPLLFFWALALFAFLRFERSNAVADAVLLGAAIGSGLLAKYAMSYFILCAVIYSLSIAERPHVLSRPKFVLAIAVALAILAPNIIWNAANDFPTVAHTGENIGWGRSFPNIVGFAEFFAAQFAVMGPILFGVLMATYYRLPREGMSRQQWLLIAFSAPILVLIGFQALMAKAYANWAALAYVAGAILVSDIMINRIPSAWNRFSTTVHGAVLAVIMVAVAFSKPGQLPLPQGSDPFARMHGAVAIADETRKHLAKGGFAAILVDDRRMAALMHYYLRDAAMPILSWRPGETPRDHFEMTRPWQAKKPSPVLYMTRNANPARVVSAFGDAELLSSFEPGSREIGRVSFYSMRSQLDASQ
jgi:4-amino-4-deoxy-L-arabinose transferase-like glycosyltransferase